MSARFPSRIIIFYIVFSLIINSYYITTIKFNNFYKYSILIGLAALILGGIFAHHGIDESYYLILFSSINILIAPIIIIVLSPINTIFELTNSETARVLLSTIILLDASIFAIVVSLSLVIMQIESDSYSYRVLNLFSDSFDLKIICFLYISLIILGLGLLKLIESENIQDTYLNIYLVIFCQFDTFAILSLIIYFKNIINLLNPLVVINKLNKKVLKGISFNSIPPGSEEDPIQPIVDVIEKTIIRREERIAIYGLDIIKDDLLLSVNKKLNCDFDLAKIIAFHFKRLGIIGINQKQFTIVETIINYLKEMSNISIGKKYKNFIPLFIGSLEDIGVESIKYNSGSLLHNTIISIGSIGGKASRGDSRNVALQASKSLGNIAFMAIEHNMAESYIASACLGNIGMNACERLWKDVTKETLVSLGKIAKISVEKDDFGTAKEAIFNIKELSIRLKGSKLNDIIKIAESIILSVNDIASSKDSSKNSINIIHQCGDLINEINNT